MFHLSNLFSRAMGSAAFVWVQNPIILDKHSEPEPDIALLRPRNDFYKSSHPRPGDVLLIVEVADTSPQYDRHVKIPLYARYGIPEVWLVDLTSKVMTLFHVPGGQDYREVVTLSSLGMLSPKQLPAVSLDLSGLF